MPLATLPSNFGRGGSNLTDGTLLAILRELQGRTVSVVTGAAAGTKMNVAALRTEDTLHAAIVHTDASAAAIVDDVANLTIQETRATGTLTVASVVNGNSCVVNGVTYTFRTTPTGPTDIKILGTDALNAAALAAAINTYENRYTSSVGRNPAAVIASANAAVVTITSVVDGVGPKATVTGTPTRLAATNSGTYVATLTAAAAVNNDTFAITDLAGSVVTFTLKTTPVASVKTDVGLGVDNATQAVKVANAINAYQNATGTLGVVATAVGAAVNISPIAPKGGNDIVLTGTVTVLAASGSGTLAGGTATGGIKSTTNLTGKTLVLHWSNKA